MESLHISEVSAVSRYWTPAHIDVTDEPLTYAPPKAAWIDRLAQRRPLAPIDARDRLARRRMHTHAVVEPQEIPVLPAITIAEPPPGYRLNFAPMLDGLRALFTPREGQPGEGTESPAV